VKARRCGFGVPLDQFDPQTRQVIADFKRWLAGEVAIAADGVTYVELDGPRAAHFVPKREVS
jgi:hypothetical protein